MAQLLFRALVNVKLRGEPRGAGAPGVAPLIAGIVECGAGPAEWIAMASASTLPLTPVFCSLR